MKYLIVQDWSNTHGNHAGMVHMCKLLKEKYSNDYQYLVMKEPKRFRNRKGLGGILKRIWNHFIGKRWYYNYKFPHDYLQLCQPMFEKLKDGDEVFLLEYLLPWAPQYKLATYIKKHYPFVKLYALSHLTVKFFDEVITKEDKNIIEKWSQPIDKMLTLGSSLSRYLCEHGVEKNKVSTGFHYVDADYYYKKEELIVHKPLQIIAMGNLQRDYSLLAKVVKGTPNVHYIICHGRTSVGNLFDGCDNVELKGYLSEDELKLQMDIADVSINIMEDTIGSNVITTSLAMGLAMVVSDVGSIHDYCDESNSVFCRNEAGDFIQAIKHLSLTSDEILKMKDSSLKKSEDLHISKIHEWFISLNK